jgi:hypothetical protein
MNDIIKLLLPTLAGSIITLFCSLVITNFQLGKESKKEKKIRLQNLQLEYIAELKLYYKTFTKYLRYINALYNIFSMVLKKEIKFEEWISNTERLNELDIDEMGLIQKLYFDSSISTECFSCINVLNDIILKGKEKLLNGIYENIKEYEEEYKKVIAIGVKHQNEIIKKILDEKNKLIK